MIVEGERKLISLTRFAKDAARMYNYWRTASAQAGRAGSQGPVHRPQGCVQERCQRSGLK